MNYERCSNQNHTKMNVSVRFCSGCGEVVNRKIQARNCNSDEHAKRRKNRDHFCVDCGKSLRGA